jgi:hypothetical protein
MRRMVPLFVLGHDGVKLFAPSTIADARHTTPPAEIASAAPATIDF